MGLEWTLTVAFS